MTAPSLAERFSQVHARSLFVQAALLGAHGAAGDGGFRATDVRFFFLLFTNWLEHDVLHPEQDIDLTQVRRALVRLAAEGLVTTVAAGGRAARGQRFRLTSAGLVALVEALVDPRPRRPFEETLFIVCFAVSYRPAIVARVEVRSARQVTELLDPARILIRARNSLVALMKDLDERVASGNDLVDEARRASAEDPSLPAIAHRLEQRSAYQLHRVRPYAELVASLPEDLQRFELGEGIARRVEILFGPLAAQVRAQIASLDALATRLAAPALRTPPP